MSFLNLSQMEMNNLSKTISETVADERLPTAASPLI